MIRRQAKKAVDQVVEEIVPLLKERGFRKRRRCWNRSRGEFVDVIRIQESKTSDPERRDFTVNLGVFVPAFHEAIWGEAPKGFAVEADCAVRLRLGALTQGEPMGHGPDIWWVLADGDESAALAAGREIRDALEEFGVPFFDQFRDFPALADHMRNLTGWQSKDQLAQMHRALAEWRIGDTDRALETLARIKGWEEKVRIVRDVIVSAS